MENASLAWANDMTDRASRTLGPKSCAECHTQEYAIWETTHHALNYRSMPSSNESKSILKNLNLTGARQEALCMQCHFTNTLTDAGALKAVSGVSCESCHAPSQDWIKVHDDYGSYGSKESEPEAAREARITTSQQKGMNHPSNIYSVIQSCYACHVIQNEELIQKGGHPTGEEFEVVSWSQGEIRHNIWGPANASNPPASQERQRRMYLTGQILNLGYLLKALSQATPQTAHHQSITQRTQSAIDRVTTIQSKLQLPLLASVLDQVSAWDLQSASSSQLQDASTRILALAQESESQWRSMDLSLLDEWLPNEKQYKGQAMQGSF